MSVSFDAPGADYGYEPASGTNTTSKPDPYGYDPSDPEAGKSLAKTGGRPTNASLNENRGGISFLGTGIRIRGNNTFFNRETTEGADAANVSIDDTNEPAPMPAASTTAATRKRNRGVRSVFQRGPSLGAF